MMNLRDNGRSAYAQSVAVVPPLLIEPAAYAKLRTYVNASDLELSGLGLVDYVDGELVVRDLYLLPQRCSAATTDIEERDVAEFLNELVRSGADPRRLRFHWHSHARSPVFWSTTDRDTQLRSFAQSEWYVFLVTNHAGDVRAALHVNYPVAGCYDGLPVSLWVEPEERRRLQDEVVEKVRAFGAREWVVGASDGDDGLDMDSVNADVPVAGGEERYDGLAGGADEPGAGHATWHETGAGWCPPHDD